MLVLGWTMLSFLFERLLRRAPANDIRPGNRYRRKLGSHLAATATVLDLRSDLVGIPHVQFAITIEGSATRLSKGDNRILALQSFLDDYREPLGNEPQPDPTALTVQTLSLLPKLP